MAVRESIVDPAPDTRRRISKLKIDGFRVFRDFGAELAGLEVIVGANGSGKSCLFGFLRFIRDSIGRSLPREIILDAIGLEVFRRPGPDKIGWSISTTADGVTVPLIYEGEVFGPVGNPRIADETVSAASPKDGPVFPQPPFLRATPGGVVIHEPGSQNPATGNFPPTEPNSMLVLGWQLDSRFRTLASLRDYVRDWRFYNGFDIDTRQIREPSTVGDVVLAENGANLASLLHHLALDHRDAFQQLKVHVAGVVPGFADMNVVTRRVKGKATIEWFEHGSRDALTLADLSDGTLRFLCWAALAMLPNPPPLVCIDEPELGLHPRALDTLVALFQSMSTRTQVLLAAHNSYFVSQFDLASIAVMRKRDGAPEFVKPGDSAAFVAALGDYGPDGVARMHASDELERIP